MGEREVPACNERANTAFEILGNSRRRRLLASLVDAGGEAPLDELAASVATDEYDVHESEEADSLRRKVFIPLYQIHVPRLEEAGIVSYDAETGIVQLIDTDPILEPILCGRRPSRRWYRYYVGLSFFGIIVLLLALLDALPARGVLWTVLALVLVSGTILLVGLQYWYDGR